MTFSEVRQQLANEGLNAVPWKINHGIFSGRIPPVPKDGSGNRDYSRVHLDAIRDLLRNPPRQGKRNVVAV